MAVSSKRTIPLPVITLFVAIMSGCGPAIQIGTDFTGYPEYFEKDDVIKVTLLQSGQSEISYEIPCKISKDGKRITSKIGEKYLTERFRDQGRLLDKARDSLRLSWSDIEVTILIKKGQATIKELSPGPAANITCKKIKDQFPLLTQGEDISIHRKEVGIRCEKEVSARDFFAKDVYIPDIEWVEIENELVCDSLRVGGHIQPE